MNKLVFLLPLTVLACSPAPKPLPSGPPPKYEAPRVYDPDANIDQLPAGEAAEEGGFGMMPAGATPAAPPATAPATAPPADTASAATTAEPAAGSAAPAPSAAPPPQPSDAPPAASAPATP